jgi:signal transduction histidine kinase
VAGESETKDAGASRLALLDGLRNAERRAAISRVASVIAHLIGTPLQVIAGRAALIRSNPTPENAAESARRIEEQVDRLAQRIRKLIDYLTSPDQETEPKSVASLVLEAFALYTPIARQRGVELLRRGEPPEVMVDGNSTMVVLTSLFSLAVRVAERGGSIELAFEHEAEHMVVFEVSIPGFVLPNAPIDRLDPPENGELSSAEYLQVLSVCHAIARKSGGKLLASSANANAVIRFECPSSP